MNRFIYLVLLFAIALPALSQNSSPDAIRKQMAKIRQTTNWNDPAAAKKANEEIQKLARQMTGQPVKPAGNASQSTKTPGELLIKSPATEANVLAIASRFYARSYKALDAISKQQFDLDYKQAGYDKFSFNAVRKLTSAGATLTALGNDHNLACVYLTAALKARPTDTLSANNFGGYLRVIDSIEASVPVLLYANSLFGQSPVILTQLGCSYIELNDEKTGENYLKQAIEYNPDFGQAHSALCDLYIKQNRLKEAIGQLFAGVKGIGVSYAKASNNYAYMQKQAEDAGEAGNQSAKEDFWDETRNQLEPPDPLASLVPEDDRIKMPSFPNCDKVADWTEGGGYSSAVDAYGRFHAKLMAFSNEFLQVHTELPSLPPNAILRDYPNERFALDCITEYFFQESDKVDKRYQEKIDEIMKKDYDEINAYLEKHERLVKTYVGCVEGCGAEEHCIEECHRKYCSEECPAANITNGKHQGYFEDSRKQFRDMVKEQERLLDDLYTFSGQWLSKIESPYWNKIYAYEVQRVALSIVGNAYGSYPQAFMAPMQNDCGTDCSLYANPYPIPAEEVETKKPRENPCPEDSKLSLGFLACSADFDCESIEFGCSAGAAVSVKRNFKNKSTTLFVGAGGEAHLGVAGGELKAGVTLTRTDGGDTDIGGKVEMSATVGGPVKVGKNMEMSATVMEGGKMETKNVIGVGL